MFKDAFVKLDAVQAAQLTQTLSPFSDITFDPKQVTAMVHDLPFYKGFFLAELSDHTQNPAIVRTFICQNENRVYPVTWSNDIIYDLNETVPINLNNTTVESYVRFFFCYVRGRHGRFLVVDTVDDIDWRDEPAPAGRKALGRMIQPLTLLPRGADRFILQASMVFKDSLYQAKISVSDKGIVTMGDEELLVESLPVADDVFGI